MSQAAGIALKSLASSLLDGRTLSAEQNPISKCSAASLYTSGADTVGPPTSVKSLYPD
jgi:hypothetical protein